MEGGSPWPAPAHKRHKRGSRARIRAVSSSGDVTGSDSGDVDGSSADGVGPSASTNRVSQSGRARTDGLSIRANYQQHVVSCKGPWQMRSEALVCPCSKSFPPWHKLNFER
jgi:hypothetical protein